MIRVYEMNKAALILAWQAYKRTTTQRNQQGQNAKQAKVTQSTGSQGRHYQGCPTLAYPSLLSSTKDRGWAAVAAGQLQSTALAVTLSFCGTSYFITGLYNHSLG